MIKLINESQLFDGVVIRYGEVERGNTSYRWDKTKKSLIGVSAGIINQIYMGYGSDKLMNDTKVQPIFILNPGDIEFLYEN